MRKETTDDARTALNKQPRGRRMRRRPKDTYIEKDGGEGAKSVWLEELGGCEEESRMENLCQCPVRYWAQKGTTMMINE